MAGPCTLLAVLALAGQPATPLSNRVAVAGVWPLGWGASLDVAGGPLRLRADGQLGTGVGGWSVGLEWPIVASGGVTLGPVAVAYQTFMPPTCPDIPGFACPRIAPSDSGYAFGVSARGSHGPWTWRVSPSVSILPQPDLPPIPGSGAAPTPQPPRILYFQMVLAGPPLFEVSYQLTPRLDVSLRGCLTPVALGWRF